MPLADLIALSGPSGKVQSFRPRVGAPTPYSRTGGGSGGRKSAVNCAFCGQSGHVSSKCFQNPNATTQCPLCGKFGHAASSCFVTPTSVSRAPAGAQARRALSLQTDEELFQEVYYPPVCQQPYFSSAFDTAGPVCRVCSRPGHVSTACFMNPSRSLTCHFCQKQGHVSSSCDANPHRDSVCHRCGKIGHVATSCTVAN